MPQQYEQIPSWIQKRFQALEDSVHLEASIYGVVDRLANLAFSDACFMVKPQPKLQTLQPGGGHMRTDSYNNQVTVTQTTLVPDFIVVGVDTENGSPSGDTPVLCIEVKRDNQLAMFNDYQAALLQLHKYLQVLQKKKPDVPIIGILLSEKRFHVYISVKSEKDEVPNFHFRKMPSKREKDNSDPQLGYETSTQLTAKLTSMRKTCFERLHPANA